MRTGARLLAIALARAAALCTGFAVVAAFGFSAHDVVLATRPSNAVATIRVSGDVDGLIPGGPTVPLTLTLRNTGDAPARVATVTTTSTGTSRPRACEAAHLHAGTWHGALSIPAGGAARVTVPVRLDAATPNACADATWGLAYTAQ